MCVRTYIEAQTWIVVCSSNSCGSKQRAAPREEERSLVREWVQSVCACVSVALCWSAHDDDNAEKRTRCEFAHHSERIVFLLLFSSRGVSVCSLCASSCTPIGGVRSSRRKTLACARARVPWRECALYMFTREAISLSLSLVRVKYINDVCVCAHAILLTIMRLPRRSSSRNAAASSTTRDS